MALNSKVLAPFIGASIAAGGREYDEVVKGCVEELAESLELKDLEQVAIKELQKISSLDDDAFDEYLATAAEAVTDNGEAVLLICLNVLASDLVITADEMTNYFAFADVLNIPEDRASEIFDDFVDEADDLTIEEDED